VEVVYESFAEKGRYQAEILAKGKFLLRVSYRRKVLRAWQTNNAIATTSDSMGSTVLASKLSKEIVARIGMVCKEASPNSGVRNFDGRNIENGFHMVVNRVPEMRPKSWSRARSGARPQRLRE